MKVDRLGSSPITKGLNCPFFFKEVGAALFNVRLLQDCSGMQPAGPV